MKNNFEERKQNRIEFARQQAAKNRQQAQSLHSEADKMASYIPAGQPILVGHHSEKRHRNYLDKIHNKMRKGFETQDKAQYYEDKAKSIETNNAIFSDDPQALDKLKEKLNTLQERQEFMKAANKCIRKKDKEAFLKIPRATEEMWQKIMSPDCYGGLGFADYELRNQNANITRIKKRIAQLEKVSNLQSDETTINGVRLVQNVEANRVQLFFDGIPGEEVRKKLKNNGFRWCRSEGAWQRHLTGNGLFAAKFFLKQLSQ